MQGFRIEDENESIRGKDTKMDVKKLNAIVQEVQDDLKDVLITTDIWATADGTVIAGFNSNPKAAALLNRIGQGFIDALKGSKFRPLEKYYMLDLHDGKMVLCLMFDDYWWGMVLETEKVQLGLLLNVVAPKAMEGFNEAVSG